MEILNEKELDDGDVLLEVSLTNQEKHMLLSYAIRELLIKAANNYCDEFGMTEVVKNACK